MRLKITDIQDKVIEQYNLKSLVTQDGYVYSKITKGMYGLPQAGIIAQELLEKRLAEYGYHQSKIINGFWKHKTRLICFCLVVDDFAVKYVNQDDADHLINAVRKYYPMTVDNEATKYIGLTVEWDYENQKPTSTCQATSRKYSRDSNMKRRRKSKTPRTHTGYHNMERSHNIKPKMTKSPPPY